MPRAKSGKISKNRHKKILKLAKGYRGRAKNCYRIAIEKVEKGLRYAYRDRRSKKRNFRRLWIQRINAAARNNGLTYSQLFCGIKLANIELDRKSLAEIAINDEQAFCDIAKQAQEALNGSAKGKKAA